MRRLDWDSEFFGIEVGMAEDPHESTAGYDVTWILLDTPLRVQEAEAHGYRFRDIRAEYARATYSFHYNCRLARDSDADWMIQLARTAHTNTRFYADLGFTRDHCADLYDTWMRRAISEDKVFVAGNRSGYVTVRDGSIGLIAVAPEARGHGVGADLVNDAIVYCHSLGLDEIRVVTQGANIAANRLFQHCGFRLESTKVWMSKWSGKDWA